MVADVIYKQNFLLQFCNIINVVMIQYFHFNFLVISCDVNVQCQIQNYCKIHDIEVHIPYHAKNSIYKIILSAKAAHWQ